MPSARGLILEDLSATGKLPSLLAHKKIGYYLEYFDPVTVGHEQAIGEILKKRWCDYILVYPIRKHNDFVIRAPLSVRTQMLFAQFAKHPRVIVTALSPVEVQNILMEKTSPPQGPTHGKKRGLKNSKLVRSRFPGTQYLGILENDGTIPMLYKSHMLSSLMRGVALPLSSTTPFRDEVWDEAINLPVSGFVTVNHPVHGLATDWITLASRPVIGNVSVPYPNQRAIQEALCELLREKINPSPDLVSPEISAILKSHDFYQRPFHPSYSGLSPMAREIITTIKGQHSPTASPQPTKN